MKLFMNLIYAFSIILFANSCQNQIIEKTHLIHGVSKIYEENNKLYFYLGKYQDETLLIQVEKENLLLSDGFTKNDSVFMHPKVLYGDKIIYTDDTRKIYSLKKEDITLANDVYDTKYLILKEIDVLFQDKFCVIEINNNEVLVSFSLSDYLEDIDNDGFVEIGGFGIIEGYCSDCDSGYYSPAKIYELNKTYRLDSTTSRKMTLERYDKFLGYDNEYIPVKFTKQYLESLKENNDK